MALAWQEYQERCAAVFRRLGLNAEVDKQVTGVRADHAVDVYVSGKFHGLESRWIIECKDWKSNVPKEKALALISVVQDTGADKGILLSEVGFQSGAVRAVRGTNIILSSVLDLEREVQNDFKEVIISNLSWRLVKVTDRLRALDRDAEDYVWTPQLKMQAKLFVMDIALQDALKNDFPFSFKIGTAGQRIEAPDFDSFVARADGLLREAEEHCVAEEERRHSAK